MAQVKKVQIFGQSSQSRNSTASTAGFDDVSGGLTDEADEDLQQCISPNYSYHHHFHVPSNPVYHSYHLNQPYHHHLVSNRFHHHYCPHSYSQPCDRHLTNKRDSPRGNFISGLGIGLASAAADSPSFGQGEGGSIGTRQMETSNHQLSNPSHSSTANDFKPSSLLRSPVSSDMRSTINLYKKIVSDIHRLERYINGKDPFFSNGPPKQSRCIVDFINSRTSGNSILERASLSKEFVINHILSNNVLREKQYSVGQLDKIFCSQWLNHRQIIFACPEAGLAFKKGDILHVVNMDEEDWWQARREASINDEHLDPFYYTVIQAGLIPSKSLQEKRMVASRDIRDLREYNRLKHLKNNHPVRYKIKRSLNKYRKVKKIMYRVKDADEFVREDIVTYLEVDILKSSTNSTYRPLILIAPYPLDTNRLIDNLIEHDSRLFSRPVAHTTRQPYDWERDGFDYHFVSVQWFLNEVKSSRFPEYGKFRDNYYGVHLSSIISIIEKGKLCLLNPNPRALKLLYTPKIKPYIVFLRPSYDLLFQKSSKFIPLCINSDYLPVKTIDLKQMALNSMKLEYLYSQYFDRILTVEEEEQIMKCLFDTVKLINIEDQWVPATWIS